mgnify:CR=1 FL=1
MIQTASYKQAGAESGGTGRAVLGLVMALASRPKQCILAKS